MWWSVLMEINRWEIDGDLFLDPYYIFFPAILVVILIRTAKQYGISSKIPILDWPIVSTKCNMQHLGKSPSPQSQSLVQLSSGPFPHISWYGVGKEVIYRYLCLIIPNQTLHYAVVCMNDGEMNECRWPYFSNASLLLAFWWKTDGQNRREKQA